MRLAAEAVTLIVGGLTIYKLLFHDRVIMPALRRRWDRRRRERKET